MKVYVYRPFVDLWLCLVKEPETVSQEQLDEYAKWVEENLTDFRWQIGGQYVKGRKLIFTTDIEHEAILTKVVWG